MGTGFALWKNDVRDLGWGMLSLDASGTLSLGGPSGSAAVRLDPAHVPYVDVYLADDWLCAVGGSDPGLVVGRAASLERVAGLERAREDDRLGFEAHTLRFHDRPGHDQCVLSWEIGVALVDPEAGVVWSYVHGDVHQRVMAITAQTVELRGLYRAVCVDLDEGTASSREFRARPAEHDSLMMAEWMRGIGR